MELEQMRLIAGEVLTPILLSVGIGLIVIGGIAWKIMENRERNTPGPGMKNVRSGVTSRTRQVQGEFFRADSEKRISEN